jgi:MFS family permease
VTRARIVRRHTALLALAQASIWLTTGVFVAAGPIALVQLTARPFLSGFLFTIWSLFVAIGAQITGLSMDRFGRRPGLALGQGLLFLASLVAAVAVSGPSAPGLLLSAMIAGFGAGGALLGRTAIGDMYTPDRRGLALGFLLAAGTAGAIVGPQVVNIMRALFAGSQTNAFARAWLTAAAVSAIAFGCVMALRPDPRELAGGPSARTVTGRPLPALLSLTPIRAAVIVIALAQMAMVAIMAVTAVALRSYGIGLVTLVLSAHFGGMFAFAPVWGAALDVRGRRQALLAAGGLTVGGALLACLAPQVGLSGFGVFLVGLGWSGAYVGATTVISDFTSARERGTVLGFADLASSGAGAAGASLGGLLIQASGFPAVGIVMAILLLPAVGLVVAMPRRAWTPVQRQPA